MRGVTITLALVGALALSGCEAARTTTSGASGAAATGTQPAVAGAGYAGFPTRLPSGTELAFAIRQTGDVIARAAAAPRSTTVSLALDRNRVAYVSCGLSVPPRSVGPVSPSVAGRWVALLDGAHLEQTRSDPPGGAGRYFWFAYRGRLVSLQYARHVHRAPCTATACSAMVAIDATLRAVLPATTTLATFIATHCPQS